MITVSVRRFTAFIPCIMLLASCATSNEYSTDDAAFADLYGSPSDLAQGQTGVRYARFVSTGEAPSDLYSGFASAIDPRALYVTDIAVQFRREGDVALYKMRIRPRNHDSSVIAAWPEIIEGDFRTSKNSTRHPIAARLPSDRSLGPDGTIETAWTVCTSCIGLNKTEGTLGKQAAANYFASIADAPAADQEFITLNFVKNTNRTLVEGGEAEQLATDFNVTRVEYKARIKTATDKDERLYGDARRAYRSFAKEYEGVDLAKRRESACGVLSLIKPPRVYSDEKEMLDDLDRGLDRNEKRYETYTQCVETFLADVDDTAGTDKRDELLKQESTLWLAANLEEKDRVKVRTLNEAINAEFAALGDVTTDYNEVLRKYDKAREKVTQDSRDARQDAHSKTANRNNVQDDRIVQECIAFAVANGAFTANTMSYCEREARAGVTGYGAALNKQTMDARRRAAQPKFTPAPRETAPSRVAKSAPSVEAAETKAPVAAPVRTGTIYWTEKWIDWRGTPEQTICGRDDISCSVADVEKIWEVNKPCFSFEGEITPATVYDTAAVVTVAGTGNLDILERVFDAEFREELYNSSGPSASTSKSGFWTPVLAFRGNDKSLQIFHRSYTSMTEAVLTPDCSQLRLSSAK